MNILEYDFFQIRCRELERHPQSEDPQDRYDRITVRKIEI